MVEQLGEVDQPREIPIDVFVNLDQFQRARADLEQIVIQRDLLAGQSAFANGLQSCFQPLACRLRGAPGGHLERVQLGKIGIELAIDVSLLEQMALHLAAGGLRDALGRNDLSHLETRVLVDEATDCHGGGQEVLYAASMQDEDHEFLTLRAGLGDTGCDHFVEVQSRCALRDVLHVIRVVVLAVDEDDLLGAAGNVQSILVQHPEIAGIEPARAVDGGSSGLGFVEIALRHGWSADQNVADLTVGQRPVSLVRDQHLGVLDHLTHAHELEYVARVLGIELHRATDFELVAVRTDPAVVDVDRRQGHR